MTHVAEIIKETLLKQVPSGIYNVVDKNLPILDIVDAMKEMFPEQPVQRLTADHPILRGAIDHLRTGESGNASFARWETGKGKAILLETCFVLEALAPNRLHVDRFLPPTTIRVLTDHSGNDLSEKPTPAPLQQGDARKLITQPAFRQDLLPKLLDRAEKLASERAEPSTEAARTLAEKSISAEITRLRDLAKRNPQVNESEITALEATLTETKAALKSPRLRLDSLRLIWRT